MKNLLLKIFFTFLLTLFVSFSIYAQEAIKIGEVTRLRCDLSEVPQIDDLALKLYENIDYKGFIIVYDKPKGQAIRYANEVKKVISMRTGKHPRGIFAQFGGLSENPRMELWAIPKNAREPLINPFIQNEKSSLFDNYTYWKGAYCGETRIPALRVFAEEVKQYQTLKGYIVVYGYKKKDAEELPIYLNQIKREVLKDKRLLRKLGVADSRIKIIIGGYDEVYPHAELWIVPEGAEPPKPTLSVKNASNSVKN